MIAPTKTPSGHFSPLRYPGGKGKLARFVTELIRTNNLSDGTYVEPYAGGAAVAWELLLTGIVRRVAINDLNIPVYEFWRSVLERTDELVDLIEKTPVNMASRAEAKAALMNKETSGLALGFATFFLNRTNRSGILNGGAIGGKDQSGPWKLDARYNKSDLIERILRIASMKNRIHLTNLDAIEFLNKNSSVWPNKTLVYLDPPYYEKGRDLYYNFYKHDDHANVAFATHNLSSVKWVVSYDDVEPIHDLYSDDACLQYTIGYSAREKVRGAEAMFFSPGLIIPPVAGNMVELYRSDGLKA
jgi:DNA adenine methylase